MYDIEVEILAYAPLKQVKYSIDKKKRKRIELRSISFFIFKNKLLGILDQDNLMMHKV